MKYSAVYAPKSEQDLSRSGFDTEEDAINYIETQICESCKKLVKKGVDVINYEDENGEIHFHKSAINDAMDTSCGAEWFVVEDEDYEEYQCNKDFGFLLTAAGYKITKRGIEE